MLPSFDVVYDRFDALVRHEKRNTGTNHELTEVAIRKLVEAYAIACDAIDEKSIRRTSPWPRQSGASAVAIALLVENPDVVIVNHAWNSSNNVAKRVSCFSLTEQKNIVDRKHSRCFALTEDNVRLGIRPKLVIFDSCTAFRDGIEGHIREVHDLYQCGILVFPSDLR